MCAIFGVIGSKNHELLDKMSKIQTFRGPDHYGRYSDEFVSLGNNRLAVIDKAKGNQPIFSYNNENIIFFNGTIYNFKDIKNYLIKSNITFKTDSDTEVAVNAYSYWGEKAFTYFDGMWAMAIYNIKTKTVLLSRDFLGQKPLFYSNNKKYLIFSSQISGILLDKNTDKTIDEKNIAKYFIYSHLPSPMTIYKNIKQLNPGELLIINSVSLDCKKSNYKEIKTYENLFPEKNFNLNNIFSDTIKNFIIADEKPTTLLSGGIDSFLVTKKVSEINKDIQCYNLGFNEDSFDESRDLKMLNLDYKIEYLKINDDSYIKNFFEIVATMDEPLGDASLIPTYSILKEIKNRKHKTVIGGDGGDENFFGYDIFDAYTIAKYCKKIINKNVINILYWIINQIPYSRDYLSLEFKLKRFLKYLNLDPRYIPQMWLSSLSVEEIKNYFSKQFLIYDLLEDSSNIFKNKEFSINDLQKYMFNFFLPMILTKIDRASMLNSIEYRSPFLSKYIINFSESIKNKNYEFLMKKNILKNEFKNIIPSKLYKKNKHGFSFPKDKIISNKEIISNLKLDLMINKKFFLEKINNYNKFNTDGQYLYNEIMLNYSIQQNKKVIYN
jgi:asparagine synthase (glutamine-hydrolysing)